MENENVELEEELTVDTSEEVIEESNEQVNTKTYSQEDVDAMIKEIHEKNQKAWDKRWGQEKSKMEREFEKRSELTNLLMKQTGSNSIDDLLNTTYEEYGMDRPKNTREEE